MRDDNSVEHSVKRLQRVLDGHVVDVADVEQVIRVDSADVVNVLAALRSSPPTATATDTGEAPRPSYITVTVPRPKALPTVTDADVLRALDVWHSQTTKNGTKNTATPARLRRVLEDYASRHAGATEGAFRSPHEAEHGESPPSCTPSLPVGPSVTPKDAEVLRLLADDYAIPFLRDLADRIAASRQGAPK